MVKKQAGPFAKKSLGQHFLIDKGVVASAIDLAQVGADDLVVEIGPGRGILTEALLDNAAAVVAIELDPRMISYLKATFRDPRLTLVARDVLQVVWAEILPQDKSAKVVANLPYYITSPIIQRLLEDKEFFSTMVLMVQREVAQRIAAVPGSRAYGVLSVAVQYHAQVELGPIIGPEAFAPPPDVHSALIKLIPRAQPPVETPEEILFRVVRSAFRQRRKTILNSLLASNLLESESKGEQRERLEKIIISTGLDPTQRAETISIPQYGALAEGMLPYLRPEFLPKR